jgi:hypothetical protein
MSAAVELGTDVMRQYENIGDLSSKKQALITF